MMVPWFPARLGARAWRRQTALQGVAPLDPAPLRAPRPNVLELGGSGAPEAGDRSRCLDVGREDFNRGLPRFPDGSGHVWLAHIAGIFGRVAVREDGSMPGEKPVVLGLPRSIVDELAVLVREGSVVLSPMARSVLVQGLAEIVPKDRLVELRVNEGG